MDLSLRLAGAEVSEGDVASLDLLPGLPSQEVRIRDYLHSFLLTDALHPVQVSSPHPSSNRSRVFNLKAPVTFMLVLMEKDDGLGRGIVDADLLGSLGLRSLTSKMLWPCPRTRLRNSNFICLLILR